MMAEVLEWSGARNYGNQNIRWQELLELGKTFQEVVEEPLATYLVRLWTCEQTGLVRMLPKQKN